MEELNSELINGGGYDNRLKHLLACIPDIFNHKTMLYVGAGPRLQMFDDFVKRGYECDIVEVYAPNVLKLKDVQGIRTIYLSNIITFRPTERYDVTFFWHGIEHLEKGVLNKVIKLMMTYTNKLIVFGCPYGVYKQDAIYGNPYEVHVTAWYPEDLIARKFECDTIGKRDSVRANLLAWKRL